VIDGVSEFLNDNAIIVNTDCRQAAFQLQKDSFKRMPVLLSAARRSDVNSQRIGTDPEAHPGRVSGIHIELDIVCDNDM
jgi:hypothetical protein